MEIAEEATEQPIRLIPKLKSPITKMSARQILKLILLALALIVWYPLYSPAGPLLPLGGL